MDNLKQYILEKLRIDRNTQLKEHDVMKLYHKGDKILRVKQQYNLHFIMVDIVTIEDIQEDIMVFDWLTHGSNIIHKPKKSKISYTRFLPEQYKYKYLTVQTHSDDAPDKENGVITYVPKPDAFQILDILEKKKKLNVYELAIINKNDLPEETHIDNVKEVKMGAIVKPFINWNDPKNYKDMTSITLNKLRKLLS